jgi:hypothetical protein
MANYLQATSNGIEVIQSTDLPEGADILYPHDFMDDLKTLKDGEVIFTYVYPDELKWIILDNSANYW